MARQSEMLGLMTVVTIISHGLSAIPESFPLLVLEIQHSELLH